MGFNGAYTHYWHVKVRNEGIQLVDGEPELVEFALALHKDGTSRGKPFAVRHMPGNNIRLKAFPHTLLIIMMCVKPTIRCVIKLSNNAKWCHVSGQCCNQIIDSRAASVLRLEL